MPTSIHPPRIRRDAEVAGVHIQYHLAGAGDPVVLVHGLSGSSRWWARNLAPLAERYTVYLVDLPGFGAMRHLRRAFVLARAAHWLREWMRTAGLARAHLVGHSMGGLIAIRLAAAYPEVVRRLVLATPAGIPTAKTLLGEVVPLIRAIGATTPAFLPVLAYDALRAGPLTLLRASQALLREDVRDDLARIAAPTLLIWGSRDTLVPPSLGSLMCDQIPSARLVVIPGAGHVVMFDRPDQFNAELLTFLAGESERR
ncbi:MAG TPA: alpha/beta fold hydrolase [Ktedonobacterales bacterium]|nr:alpha/beta fold hydrolase [Ktedonobacterales bacterium]